MIKIYTIIILIFTIFVLMSFVESFITFSILYLVIVGLSVSLDYT